VQAAFVGKHGFFNMLLSPNGQSVIGGFVNDAGNVAYTDGVAGYVYGAGATTSFSVPLPSYNVQIQAINNQGRVVGTYTDTSQNPAMQHIFLYNGSAVSSFGAYAMTDTVHAALNDHGVMVVSDSSNGQQMALYRVTCSGSGC
jgi:probable HAF family extracellular repeat protein